MEHFPKALGDKQEKQEFGTTYTSSFRLKTKTNWEGLKKQRLPNAIRFLPKKVGETNRMPTTSRS